MATYADSLTVRAARAEYFAANGFGDGGYDKRWVKLQAGPIPLYFPNTAARVAAVRFHDLHHVATGYDTTWTGEAEIGAWELASGCARHYAAWILNLQVLPIGVCLDAPAMLRAFVRGRRSANLYRERFDDRLLTPTVGALRGRLGLAAPPARATAADVALLGVWSLAGVVTLLLTAALVLAPVAVVIALVVRALAGR